MFESEMLFLLELLLHVFQRPIRAASTWVRTLFITLATIELSNINFLRAAFHTMPVDFASVTIVTHGPFLSPFLLLILFPTVRPFLLPSASLSLLLLISDFLIHTQKFSLSYFIPFLGIA